MAAKLLPARSLKLPQIVAKMADARYRHSFVASFTRQFLARQIRAFRGSTSQEDFGDQLGKPQSVISRLEDPNYGKWTLQTLFDVAAALNRAVIVRIVDFPTFLNFYSDTSAWAVRPPKYDQRVVDDYAGRGMPLFKFFDSSKPIEKKKGSASSESTSWPLVFANKSAPDERPIWMN